MKAEEALRELPGFLKRASYVNVLVVAQKSEKTEPMIQRLSLHESVAQDFRNVALESTTPDGLILRKYEPGYTPGAEELLYLELKDESEVAATVTHVARAGDAEHFAEAEEVVDALRFYVIVVGAGGGRQAVLFRSYSPKKELSRRPGFALMLQRGSYDRLTRKVFLFDEDVDCFAWDQIMFVRNVAAFQRIFKYFEQLREKAAATVDAVMERVPIGNGAAFKAACTEQLPMMAKLAQIASKPYLPRIRMTDIRRAIEEFTLDIKIVEEAGAEKLLFESEPRKRWLILKLLDDDFLGSVMSREKYEVNSKVSLVPTRDSVSGRNGGRA
jgi:hypothetical protein